MTWIVSLSDEHGRNVLTASVTSGEMVERLKAMAREFKFRVEVKEQPGSKVVHP